MGIGKDSLAEKTSSKLFKNSKTMIALPNKELSINLVMPHGVGKTCK